MGRSGLMFESWKEFKSLFRQEETASDNCRACGKENFDLLCKEEDENGCLTAIFICKDCAVQKKVEYGELGLNQ
jgi:hypothetical protein